MVNTRYVHFRVTNEQLKAIHLDADMQGCKSMAEYLRKLVLHHIADDRQRLKTIYDTSIAVEKHTREMREVSFKTYELVKELVEKNGK